MATKKIRLTRVWDGHQPGEIIEEWDVTVDSMIRKGYGVLHEDHKPKHEREIVTPRGPVVETADAPGAAEAAVVSPQIGKRGGKSASNKES